jgi:two-component system, NarL family, sensor kinase
MQTNSDQIITIVIVSTIIILLLAGLIISLLFSYQKRQIDFQKTIYALRLDFEKNILKTQVEIQEQTFQNISREIHDNISLSLTLAKLNLNTLDWSRVEETAQAVNSTVNLIGSAISDLNNLSKCMDPDMIQNMGLMKAISLEVEKLKGFAHLDVAFMVSGEPIFMDSQKELVIFRIIQEAFNNIVKHSQATRVWLQLDYCTNFLDILIRDNGIGFEKDACLANSGEKAGLHNMQNRTKVFGGKLKMEAYPKKGTQILVTVPYN